MIEQKALKKEAFLKKLSTHLTGSPNYRYDKLSELYYLGAGYWRARQRGDFWYLINPSISISKLAKVEEAMNILI